LFLPAQVIQDLVYDVLVFDTRDDFDRASTAATDPDIDIEDAFEALRSGHSGVTLGGGSGLGMAIATVGMLLLALIPEGASQGDIAWRMAVCGIGYGIFLSPNARVVISAAPLARAASAGGLISTNRLVGQALGGTLLAALLALGHGSDNTPAMIGTALAFLAGICSAARLTPANGRKHRP
jgi:hypothetical protein